MLANTILVIDNKSALHEALNEMFGFLLPEKSLRTAANSMNDPILTGKFADYYTRLEKMEREAKEELGQSPR